MRLRRLVDEAAEAVVDARRQAGDQSWAARPGMDDEDQVQDEIDQLSDDAYERLTDAEDGEFIDGPSFDAVVAAVVRDLGLTPQGCARLRASLARPDGDAGAPAEPACTADTPRPLPKMRAAPPGLIPQPIPTPAAIQAAGPP